MQLHCGASSDMIGLRHLEVFDEMVRAVLRGPLAQNGASGADELVDGGIADCMDAGRDGAAFGAFKVGNDLGVGKAQRSGAAFAEIGTRERGRATADRTVEKDIAAHVRQAEFVCDRGVGFADFRVYDDGQRTQERDVFGVFVARASQKLRMQMRDPAGTREIGSTAFVRALGFDGGSFANAACAFQLAARKRRPVGLSPASRSMPSVPRGSASQSRALRLTMHE